MITLRGCRWIFAYALLWVLALVALSHASCPLLAHGDPNDEREFQNVCQTIAVQPSITIGTTAPTGSPGKIGNMFINTTSGKVYIATGTANSGSWAIMN